MNIPLFFFKRKVNFCIVLLSVLSMSFSNPTQAQFVSQRNGPWNNGATWGNNNPGTVGVDYPAQTDAIIIQAGHQVTVNGFTSNGGPAISPEGLGLSNVGDGIINGRSDFPSGEDLMFYHLGDVTIMDNAILRINRRVIFGGLTVIQGTLRTNSDVVNIGRLNATSTAILDIGDDYIMTGNSVTDIDGAITAVDDLYIDHVDAVLGGSGSLTIADDIQTFNPRNHDPHDQICATFVVDCGDDCDPSRAAAQRTITGTSNHPICLDLFPVEFENVEAKAVGSYDVLVSWTTATETNNDRFEIERSSDGTNWETVGTVYGAGTSEQENHYRFNDLNPMSGNIYYRIKQIDFDETFSYSKQVVTFIELAEGALVIAPNPVERNQPIQLLNAERIEMIEVIDQYGSRVKIVENPNRSITTNFGTGVFNLRIKTNAGWSVRRIVVL